MVFDTARPVEMRRFTETEEEQFIKNPDLLGRWAVEAFERFKLPKGIGLKEARRDDDDPPSATPPDAAP